MTDERGRLIEVQRQLTEAHAMLGVNGPVRLRILLEMALHEVKLNLSRPASTMMAHLSNGARHGDR